MNGDGGQQAICYLLSIIYYLLLAYTRWLHSEQSQANNRRCARALAEPVAHDELLFRGDAGEGGVEVVFGEGCVP